MAVDRLSLTFGALADPTRRAILGRLRKGGASVTELAEPFDMSLPAVSKHLKVLERAGLVTRGKEAQWRPKGVSNAVAEFEARPGGKIFIAERALDGATIYIAGVVREIERPSRVLYAIHFADADRKRVAPPAHSGLGDTWDDEIVTLVTFSAEGRRTRMTIRTLSGFTTEWGEKARFGWAESLDKLERALKLYTSAIRT